MASFNDHPINYGYDHFARRKTDLLKTALLFEVQRRPLPSARPRSPNIVPDLIICGKSWANGYPFSFFGGPVDSCCCWRTFSAQRHSAVTQPPTGLR